MVKSNLMVKPVKVDGNARFEPFLKRYVLYLSRAGNLQPGPPGSTQPALKKWGRAKEIGTQLYRVGSGY